MTHRELFLRHLAQTSDAPLGLEIVKAEDCLLYDVSGKEYIDLIGGISVANIGHRHPEVVKAIKNQVDHYLHVMVYGEFVQTPQVRYAKLLTTHLPETLNTVYFTNSGAEAIEGAMKLAKRVNGKTQIIAFKNSYHGSTQGALSLIGDEYWRNSFRPLLPDILHLDYNSTDALKEITGKTACIVAESIQGEAGIIAPSPEWMRALGKKCTDEGALLILDEVQTGFGRTGRLWGFEHFGVVPDILVLGKSLGGGMPLGAFIAARDKMQTLSNNPALGHITTFGGHPVSCAAGLAAMKVLLESQYISSVKVKENLFKKLLVHPKIKGIRSFGLWMAVEFNDVEISKRVVQSCIKSGVLTDWFLFSAQCLRISPPLNITEEQITAACNIILSSINRG